MINFWSYLLQYEEEKEQIYNAIERVMKSGRVILGESLSNFEKEFANYCNVKYGIGVNSGTDALFIALKTLDIGKGDEVITVPNTAIPTVSAICATGAKPVFVDVNPKTFLINVNQIREHITKNTKCVLPVHLYGQCCDMDAILEIANEHNLYIVEDCAQSMGAIFSGKKTGSFGILSCFSFYPTKNLGGYGDGGAILTNSKKLYKRVKSLRMYGEIARYKSNEVGHNSRLDEIQAAILRIKLRYVNRWNEKRRKLAFIYREQLKNLPVKLLKEEQEGKSVYHLFVVYVNRRKALTRYLQKRGILTGIHYPISIHLTEAFKYLKYKRGAFPVSERSNRKILSLPMHPNLRENQVIEICKNIEDFYRSSSTVNS